MSSLSSLLTAVVYAPLAYWKRPELMMPPQSIRLSRQPVRSSLDGKRIALTCAEAEAPAWIDLLHQFCAEPLIYPAYQPLPIEDAIPLDIGLLSIQGGQFDWILLSDVTVTYYLAERLKILGIPTDSLRSTAVFALGIETARAALHHLGGDVRVIREQPELLVVALVLNPTPGTRILLPHLEGTSPTLIEVLEDLGADVFAVSVYRLAEGQGGVDLPGLVAHDAVDALIFDSPLNVHHFYGRFLKQGGSLEDLSRIAIACLDQSTVDAALERGLTVDVQPCLHTRHHLLNALEAHFGAAPHSKFTTHARNP